MPFHGRRPSLRLCQLAVAREIGWERRRREAELPAWVGRMVRQAFLER